MVFNKTLFVFGLIAISFVSAYPAGTNEKSEVVAETTERALNDDVPVVVTTELSLADDTTVLPVFVRSEVNEAVVQSEAVPEIAAPTGEVPAPIVPIVVIPEEKTSPVVVAEVIGEKIVPVVEIVNVVQPEVPAPSTGLKNEGNPKDNTVEGRSR